MRSFLATLSKSVQRTDKYDFDERDSQQYIYTTTGTTRDVHRQRSTHEFLLLRHTLDTSFRTLKLPGSWARG